jgi:hypothetical protein
MNPSTIYLCIEIRPEFFDVFTLRLLSKAALSIYSRTPPSDKKCSCGLAVKFVTKEIVADLNLSPTQQLTDHIIRGCHPTGDELRTFRYLRETFGWRPGFRDIRKTEYKSLPTIKALRALACPWGSQSLMACVRAVKSGKASRDVAEWMIEDGFPIDRDNLSVLLRSEVESIAKKGLWGAINSGLSSSELRAELDDAIASVDNTAKFKLILMNIKSDYSL